MNPLKQPKKDQQIFLFFFTNPLKRKDNSGIFSLDGSELFFCLLQLCYLFFRERKIKKLSLVSLVVYLLKVGGLKRDEEKRRPKRKKNFTVNGSQGEPT